MEIWKLVYKAEGKSDQRQPFKGTLEEVRQHARDQLRMHHYYTVEVFDSRGVLRASFDNKHKKPKAS